jgi:ElaB/YqjD/DUF883 family membrane-anchored ribosome-binding protein
MAGWTESAGGDAGRVDRRDVTHEEGPLDTAQAGFDRAVEAATEFIRERPVAALVGAVALGWVVGKLASRR